MFEDRRDAGRQLARALDKYAHRGAIVLAIPRGGAEVGYEVAKHLGAELSIIVARKLPFPDDPEAGFGAVAEDGSVFLVDGAQEWLSERALARTIADQVAEVKRRIKVLRKGQPLPDLEGKTVILVDDGIAVGSTMRASIQLCKSRHAKEIVVAVPVASSETAREISRLVDEIVVLETPRFFQAVAQVYRNWYDVPDSEVLKIMDRWRSGR